MHKIARFFLILLSLLTGCLFLYSAYTKLNPIQSFEYTMVEFAHLPWMTAAIAARFFIGLEAALGSLIILHLFGRGKWVLKTAVGLIVIFSIYLIYLWATAGNKINCGCFGDAIWMSPSTSLIKNALLLIVLGLLIRFHKGLQLPAILPPIILVVFIGLTYILYPVPDNSPDWLKKEAYIIDLSPLYAPGKRDTPAIDLAKGKHIIAFFSSTCPHCRLAAYKMHVMKEQDTSLPFFMVIGGTRDLTEFWEKTKAQNVPYARLPQDPFIKLAGYSWPAIYFVNNSRVEAKTTYIALDKKTIEAWLRK